MADIEDYSTTPASNTDDFPEDQLPSTVNNGARETQADIAKFRERLQGEFTVGGTVDAITITNSVAVAGLVNGRIMTLRATGANTSTTPTLKEDSQVAKTIVKNGNQALVAGDIPRADYECIFKYNSTNDNYELLNPATSEGSWTPKLQDGSFSDAEGQTYTTQLGRYIRIGSTVFISGEIVISSVGTLSGFAYIAGLPYTAHASNAAGSVSVGRGGPGLGIVAGQVVAGDVQKNTNYIRLNLWDNAGGSSTMNITEISTGALVFSGQYNI